MASWVTEEPPGRCCALTSALHPQAARAVAQAVRWHLVRPQRQMGLRSACPQPRRLRVPDDGAPPVAGGHPDAAQRPGPAQEAAAAQAAPAPGHGQRPPQARLLAGPLRQEQTLRCDLGCLVRSAEPAPACGLAPPARPCTAWLSPPATLPSGTQPAWPGRRQAASLPVRPSRQPLLGRFVPLDNLEETYAGNRKRRRLLYALRRHHTRSYASWWDHLTNSVGALPGTSALPALARSPAGLCMRMAVVAARSSRCSCMLRCGLSRQGLGQAAAGVTLASCNTGWPQVFVHCQLFFDGCTPRRLRSHLPWACSVYVLVRLWQGWSLSSPVSHPGGCSQAPAPAHPPAAAHARACAASLSGCHAVHALAPGPSPHGPVRRSAASPLPSWRGSTRPLCPATRALARRPARRPPSAAGPRACGPGSSAGTGPGLLLRALGSVPPARPGLTRLCAQLPPL